MRAGRPTRIALGLLGAFTALVALAAPPAAAAPLIEVPPAVLQVGHDVSYPQCGSALPVQSTFGLVGVDGGRPYDVNPCLAEQIVWARALARPSYYLNAANPGPALSDHWPLGQRSPRVCTRGRSDSTGCAYDYGWNAAKDSLARASAAALAAGATSVTRSRWWIDVEANNTWEAIERPGSPAAYDNDVAVLTGMRDLLRRRGVRQVGVYSAIEAWRAITGAAGLSRAPVWYAGTGARRSAVRHCSPRFSFTRGPVVLTQYARNGFDADLRC